MSGCFVIALSGVSLIVFSSTRRMNKLSARLFGPSASLVSLRSAWSKHRTSSRKMAPSGLTFWLVDSFLISSNSPWRSFGQSSKAEVRCR